MFYRLMEAALSAALTTPDMEPLMVEFCRYLCLALSHATNRPLWSTIPLVPAEISLHNNPAEIQLTSLYPVHFSSSITTETEPS